MPDDLKKQFDYEMLELYRTMHEETGFRSVRSLHMIGSRGGLDTTYTTCPTASTSCANAAGWIWPWKRS